MDTVDGYTVECIDENFVRLTFSDRYGETLTFIFPVEDIQRLVGAFEELGVV